MASLKIATDLRNLIKRIIYDECYPVGSIYISMNSTSPATKFGGTLVQITDRFLYCTKSSKTTGDHTLTINEIPKHSHTTIDRIVIWDAGKTGLCGAVWNGGHEFESSDWGGSVVNNTGGGGLIPILKIFLHILLVMLGTEQLKESWCYL